MFSLRQSISASEKHSSGTGMTYLIDAQLPYLLAVIMRQKGYDVIHTDDLPNKDETSDATIRQIAAQDGRVVITKDTDFLNSYLLSEQPPRLLLLTMGNVKNRQLLNLFRQTITKIDSLFAEHSFIELDNDDLIVHE